MAAGRAFLLALLMAPAACGTPRGVASSPCERLAHPIELIARNKDGGYTKEQQIEMVGPPDPGVSGQFAHKAMLASIALVYRHPNANSREIREMVLDDCIINSEGQAELRTLWSE